MEHLLLALCGDDPEQNAGTIHVSNWEHLLAGGEGGGAMRGLETDHVISGPMRGLKINITGRGQTHIHTDIATL